MMSEIAARFLSPVVAAEAEAGRHCMETLLNCYSREVAVPDGQISFGTPFGQSDWPLALCAALHEGTVMHVLLPQTHARLVVAVEQPSLSGKYRYCSPFYCRQPGQPWTLLDWSALAVLLLRELALKHAVPFNDDLFAQIQDSVDTVAVILANRVSPVLADDKLTQYVESEQALIFGHPFHPSPKSREGFSSADRRYYSPELRGRFPLHYFAVHRDCLRSRSLLPQSADAIVSEHAPLKVKSAFGLVPVHPWQTNHLLQLPAVGQALKRGLLRDLGPQGESYEPTSSVRTLFHPRNPFFYKMSLNVRITNCIRKNAFYELEGAVEITRLLRALKPDLASRFPDLCLLEEPASLTVDLPGVEHAERIAVNEGFGLILRQGIQDLVADGITPMLAGTLFADYETGLPHARALCRRIAQQERMPAAAAVEVWFSVYLERLLYPVLYNFFANGVVFEPHLQNTLVGLRNGWPVRIVLRDFEGVKLVEGRFGIERLAHISPRARESLWFTLERGWNRIAYCLLINQLGEAVAHLSDGNIDIETRLWGLVRHHLLEYQARFGDAESKERIHSLLSGAPLPAKANLITRFFKQADRHAGYVPFPNPLAMREQPCS